MFFKVFDEIFKYFPELNVGVIIAQGIDNSKKSKKVTSLFQEAVEYVKLTYTPEEATDPKLIAQHLAKSPLISAWRAAYEEFGVKTHYNTNVETLMANIVSGNPPKSRNSLLDMCRYISLKNIIPLGAYDLDKIEGDIYLGLANTGEKFLPADSSGAERVDKNEVVYSDGGGILCRKWNWKEGRKAQVTEQTENAVIILDALPPITRGKLNTILSEASDLINMACGGKLSYRIASKKKERVDII